MLMGYINTMVDATLSLESSKTVIRNEIRRLNNNANYEEEKIYRTLLLYHNIGAKKKFNKVLDDLENLFDFGTLFMMTLDMSNKIHSDIIELT